MPDGFPPITRLRASCPVGDARCEWRKKPRWDNLGLAGIDFDWVHDCNGQFLVMDQKDWVQPGEIPKGQWIVYQRVTRGDPRFTVLLVMASPDFAEVRGVRIIRNGDYWGEWAACDRAGLDAFAVEWRSWALARPTISKADLKQLWALRGGNDGRHPHF